MITSRKIRAVGSVLVQCWPTSKTMANVRPALSQLLEFDVISWCSNVWPTLRRVCQHYTRIEPTLVLDGPQSWPNVYETSQTVVEH